MKILVFLCSNFSSVGIIRNGTLATIFDFLIPLSLQPDGVNLGYIKLRLVDLT